MARRDNREDPRYEDAGLPGYGEDDAYDPSEDIQSIAEDLPDEQAWEFPDEPDDPADDEEGIRPNETRYQREQAQAAEAAATPRGKRKKKKATVTSPIRPAGNGAGRYSATPQEGKHASAPPWIRYTFLVIVTTLFLAVILAMLVSTMMDNPLLHLPEEAVSGVMTPVQDGFSSFTDIFIDYMRRLKLRATLEEAYDKVVADNEELTYKALLADEYQIQLAQFQNMYDEVNANEMMNPIVCRVIGRTDGNYFSTFTINRGSRDGIAEYMAVTISGALVGYTEKVSETETQVRTIIDSEASIAGLIQSSRDQGTVRGTLGVNGTAMCRMYYLPDNSLPRPGDVVVTSGVGMSFPKGIPIGTVRESTRGMESNKSYVVVEPQADFQHLEYVIVLRYQPTAQAVQGRNTALYNEFVPTETARPYPTLQMFSSSFYSNTATPIPEGYLIPVGTPEPTATATATATPKPTPEPTPQDTSPVLEYHPVDQMQPLVTFTPEPEATPSPTPRVTIDPQGLTIEEDN